MNGYFAPHSDGRTRIKSSYRMLHRTFESHPTLRLDRIEEEGQVGHGRSLSTESCKWIE